MSNPITNGKESFTQDEFSKIHEIMCYLHKGQGDKTDKFLEEKYGKPAMDLFIRFAKSFPSQEEIERNRQKLIRDVCELHGVVYKN